MLPRIGSCEPAQEIYPYDPAGPCCRVFMPDHQAETRCRQPRAADRGQPGSPCRPRAAAPSSLCRAAEAPTPSVGRTVRAGPVGRIRPRPCVCGRTGDAGAERSGFATDQGRDVVCICSWSSLSPPVQKNLGTLGVNDPQIGTIPARTVKSPSFKLLYSLNFIPKKQIRLCNAGIACRAVNQ